MTQYRSPTIHHFKNTRRRKAKSVSSKTTLILKKMGLVRSFKDRDTVRGKAREAMKCRWQNLKILSETHLTTTPASSASTGDDVNILKYVYTGKKQFPLKSFTPVIKHLFGTRYIYYYHGGAGALWIS